MTSYTSVFKAVMMCVMLLYTKCITPWSMLAEETLQWPVEEYITPTCLMGQVSVTVNSRNWRLSR